MSESEEAREYMKAVLPELEGDAGPHPSVDALAAYQQGRLSGSARALVQDHLVTCDECLALFKDAGAFFAPPSEGVSELEIQREWKALWRQIKAEEEAAAPAGAVAPTAPAGWRQWKALPLALAAGLALALALPLAWAIWSRRESEGAVRRLELEQRGTAARLKELEDENRLLREQGRESRPPDGESRPADDPRAGELAASEQENRRLREQLEGLRRKQEAELAELRRPQLNAPLYDVLPQEMTVRSAAGREVTRIELPPGRKSFTLILNAEGLPPYPQYDIEIRRRGGKRVWRGTGLRQEGGGNFVLTLDRSFLGEGQYTLKLFGRSAEGTKAVAEYEISVGTGR